MDGMTASLHRKHQKKERIPCLWSQSDLQKGKRWQLFVPPLLVTKNSKTLYMAFNYQRKKQRNRTLYSNICRNTSWLAKECVYSTSQNPHGTVVGRKFFSHLNLGVTKDLTKSIRVQLDTAFTCNTLPERLAQSLIPRRQKITNYLSPSKATLFIPMTTLNSHLWVN